MFRAGKYQGRNRTFLVARGRRRLVALALLQQRHQFEAARIQALQLGLRQGTRCVCQRLGVGASHQRARHLQVAASTLRGPSGRRRVGRDVVHSQRERQERLEAEVARACCNPKDPGGTRADARLRASLNR